MRCFIESFYISGEEMIGYNRDLEYQKQVLYSIIKENRILFEIIQKAQTLEIPYRCDTLPPPARTTRGKYRYRHW